MKTINTIKEEPRNFYPCTVSYAKDGKTFEVIADITEKKTADRISVIRQNHINNHVNGIKGKALHLATAFKGENKEKELYSIAIEQYLKALRGKAEKRTADRILVKILCLLSTPNADIETILNSIVKDDKGNVVGGIHAVMKNLTLRMKDSKTEFGKEETARFNKEIEDIENDKTLADDVKEQKLKEKKLEKTRYMNETANLYDGQVITSRSVHAFRKELETIIASILENTAVVEEHKDNILMGFVAKRERAFENKWKDAEVVGMTREEYNTYKNADNLDGLKARIKEIKAENKKKLAEEEK